MLTGKYFELYDRLKKLIPNDRLIHDELRTLAYGTDASFYRLIPQLVVKVENDREVTDVIYHARELNIPLTFRAAGTSLSGQAITDSVLVLLGSSWTKYQINDDASVINMQGGLIGAFANLYLAKHNKKLGPDPASINSAKISGIAANNASGMTSGTAKNIYNTLHGMKIVFADGSSLDSTDEKSRQAFADQNPQIIAGLKQLREQIEANPDLKDKIVRKYKMKNTTGYSLNSLIDFDDPFDQIIHLMIGSEGTLGFISEISVNTVDDLPNKATALMLFENIETACKAIPIFQKLPVDAAEIMDRAALRSVEDKQGMPPHLKTLNDEAAALLVETSADDPSMLQNRIREITDAVEHLPKAHPIEFTTDKKEYKKLWDVRKGLFPSACKSRKPGTTVIIEDVNFPTDKLAEATLNLQSLFSKHGYDETIIWGHSLAGNLHFVFSQDFSNEKEVARYKDFMEEVTKLVVDKYDGSLKAEHGTGRNMAPFVKYEWGEDAYKLMQEIKKLFDPQNLLNPGVILNDDPQIYLKNLKPLPIADPLIDQCIECGFCEVNCPSRDLTLTPRQRIVAYREITGLEKSMSDSQRLNQLKLSYDYYGDQTCATDGLCAISCPVDIDTGKLIKQLRAEQVSNTANSVADFVANNMKPVTGMGRVTLNIVGGVQKLIGDDAMENIAGSVRKISGNRIPQWNKFMPKGADPLYPSTKSGADLKVVYFPSCIARTMGNSKDSGEKESQTTVIHRLLIKAGYEIIYPKNISELCCGMPFASKGFNKQANKKSEELKYALITASENGKYPVLFDTSPCTYHMKNYLASQAEDQFKIYEPIEFIYSFLMDKLKFNKVNDTITIHTTCSSTKLGLTEMFKSLAEACAENVIVPHDVGCCGFAGDRGFSYPELNESALQNLKPQVSGNCNEGYSTSRTCEIGLSLHSGIHYKSIAFLVDRCTEPMQKAEFSSQEKIQRF